MNSPLLEKSMDFATQIVLFLRGIFKEQKGYDDCKTIIAFRYQCRCEYK